jgi:amidase
VPFVIKDSDPVAQGVPFFLGSRSVKRAVALHDATVMSRFRAAGLATLGLSTAPEFALSFATESVKHGPTRNPWDLRRGVGGSSGGAAALVAAGAVPIAHGNDGAGSIRIPASCCGLVGLKPTRGRTPCGPDLAEAMFGVAYEFGLTRSVRDAAVLLDAIHGPAVGDKYTAPLPDGRYVDQVGADPGRLRVAVATEAWSGVGIDREVAASAIAVCHELADAGHHISEATPRVDWDGVVDSCAVTAIAFIAGVFQQAGRQPDPNNLEAVSRRLMEAANHLSALDLIAMFDTQNRLSRSVGAFFECHDLLVTPTLGQLPAPHGTLDYNDPRHSVRSWISSLFEYGPFTALFNITGQPAISLPLGMSTSGLPIGVQLVAPFGREDVLFRVAGQLEQAMPWKHRRPPHAVGNVLASTLPAAEDVRGGEWAGDCP